jgi:RNA polymerase sigma factor (TIGR02999 family)
MRRERPDHSLQATLLADEGFLRVIGGDAAAWNDPKHVIALAARAMRQMLTDHARARNRKKRGGGGGDRVPLDSALADVQQSSGWNDMEALDAALTRLAEIQPRAAEVVQLRYLTDWTLEQIAATLECSLSTVEREWRYARAWLRTRMDGAGEDQRRESSGSP